MNQENGEQEVAVWGIIETTMAMLGFVWTALLIVELAYGLSPALGTVFNLIWALFIVDFLVRFYLAPDKLAYLKANWLVGISLAIPAIRVLRIFHVVRLLRMAPVARGVLFVRLVASFRRSMRALGHVMRRRGFAYVVLITLIVTFSGAAGMYAFETNIPGQQDGFTSYWDALWWTAMLLTTIGSQYWPVTAEGRILSLVLSIYAVSVLGYIAAVLASFFIGRDVSQAARPKDIQRLEAVIGELKDEIRRGSGPSDDRGAPPGSGGN